VAASGKLALLDRMMVRLRAGGHRVLIYSQFTRTLDVLEDWVAGRGWGYERIDGALDAAVCFYYQIMMFRSW
jgi:SNF2 family DNA or RNA helicase